MRPYVGSEQPHQSGSSGGASTPGSVAAALACQPMRASQVVVIAVCLLINAIDGIDVQATAFTAPAIALHWQLRPEQLGVVLSAGLIGMGLGAMTLSSLADALGRRTMALGCLAAIAIGMTAAAFCSSVIELTLVRGLTGIGIGGLISSISALVTEYAPDHRRGLVMGLMAVSFPAGAMASAALSIPLIARFGWQSVFLGGAAATIGVLAVAALLLPESILLLMNSERRRGGRAAGRILAGLGLPELDPDAGAQTAASIGSPAGRLIHVTSGELGERTARLAGMFLCAMLSFYFLLNWAPKLAVQAGATMQDGLRVGLLVNLGGIAGGVVAGAMISRFGLVRVGRISLAAMALAIAGYGLLLGDTSRILALAAFAGFTLWAVQACIYTAMAIAYPAPVRATAIGVVTTAGRIGSALGPLAGGALLGGGYTSLATCLILAVPALAGGVLIAEYRVQEA